ncbi:MAG: phosphohistidine phosphatase SixA [Oligoflexia bacterium]|nr:phosphohistidine phosphatase SixA [Oligoflexia bacterium]
MQLHLVRHGDAKQSNDDFSRALSEKGVLEVELLSRKIKEGIEQNKIFINRIYHSNLLRAKETAEIIFKTILKNENNKNNSNNNNKLFLEEDNDLSLYNDNYLYIVDKLKNYSENENTEGIMLVGHMPSLTKIGEYLVRANATNKNSRIDFSFATANMVSLERDNNDEWNYLWKITPKDK